MAAVKAALNSLNILPVYRRILSKFPSTCSFSFAYGSGVKNQAGVVKGNQMVDLVFAVDNPQQWHRENMKMNANHYSFLKYLGAGVVTKYQENLGAQVYFNTLIPMKEEGILIKYGVISKNDLIADLLDWDFLYLAGRLHKPVEVIKYETDSRLHTALQANLTAAVHAALLMLPERFTEFDLYYTISGLSYSGDFRMKFGENKDKVKNIVQPQLKGFRHLYSPTISNLKTLVNIPLSSSNESVNCEHDVSPGTKHYHLSQLPANPLKLIELYHFKKSAGSVTEADDTLENLAHDKKCSEIVKKALQEIVWQSSIRQSLKNIPTAGLIKSLNYSVRKIKKMF